MELTVLEGDAAHVRAGYNCPCGCTPSVDYVRGTEFVEEGCCCGNHFTVGPRASAGSTPRAGFREELQVFEAPWGERLEATWSIGPSVHGPSGDHDHDDHPGVGAHSDAIDPVCGMSVDRDTAIARELHLSHEGIDHFFCSKGCKLEFGDGPARFFAYSLPPPSR